MTFESSTNSILSRKRIRLARGRLAVVPLFLLALAPGVARSQTAPPPPSSAAVPRVQITDTTAALKVDDTTEIATDTSTGVTAKPRSFELYGVPDKELAAKLWLLTGHSGEPMEGNYRVMFFSDSFPQAYLLRGGTQVGEFPPSALPWVRNKIRSGELKRGGDSGFWKNFWNPVDPIQPFMWNTGLNLRMAAAVFVTHAASPQFERHVDMTFAQRPLPWILTEIGGHFSGYAGGLSRNLGDPLLQDPTYEYWSKTTPWWHAAVGLPGIKWEVALANRNLPELYWLEPNAGFAAYMAGRNRVGQPVTEGGPEDHPPGILMREWQRQGDPMPSGHNISQTVHLKAGSLQYSIYMDPDVYRSVVHKAYVEGLPALMGTWGFGFYLTDGIAQSLFTYDLTPKHVNVGDPADGNILETSFLRIEVAIRDQSRYRVCLSTNVRLDSRTFTYGAKP